MVAEDGVGVDAVIILIIAEIISYWLLVEHGPVQFQKIHTTIGGKTPVPPIELERPGLVVYFSMQPVLLMTDDDD